MAYESLADFFAAHYNCNNRDIIKAAACCARGPYRKSMLEAAMAWRPTSAFHRALRQLIMLDDQPTWYGRINLLRSTPTSARVHKELKEWLRKNYPPPKPTRPPKAEDLWDILNATDRYSERDIKGGIWLIFQNNHWRPFLRRWAGWADFSEFRKKTTWERELLNLILAKPHLTEWSPPQTLRMYTVAKRIKAVLKNAPTAQEPPPLPEPFSQAFPWRSPHG